MKKVPHTFINVTQITKPKPGAVSFNTNYWGALIVCADCGHVRKLWEDAKIEIIKEGDGSCEKPKKDVKTS